MKSELAAWFEALRPFAGLLAAGLRLPDQTTITKVWAEPYGEAALANAWRCVDDTFRVMRLHRLPTRQLRWTYAYAILTAVRREDGGLLMAMTQPDGSPESNQVLATWLETFLDEPGRNRQAPSHPRVDVKRTSGHG
jgi:hypothetical protein